MSTRTLGVGGAVIIAAIVAVIALTSGGDEATTASTETDGAFITAMIPHHESAVEMAKMAREEADHIELRQLADQIITAQNDEIDILDGIHRRLFGEPAGQMSPGSLGLSEEEMGMSMDMHSLETAKPFDQEFIDQMIAHHQGAIRMARIELAQGADDEAKSLANTIVTAQSAEIEQMNVWRTEWYGEPSPSGGVPEETDDGSSQTPSGMEGMEH